MNLKLQTIFDLFNAQTVNIATYIKTEFNKLSTLGIEAMTDAEASGIEIVLENRLAKLLPCYTFFSTDNTDDAIGAVKQILKYNLYQLVIEVRNMIKAISKDIASSHTQSKFNPVDNDNIDEAPTSIDDTSFTYLSNMISQVEYLKDNSKTLDTIFRDFTKITYILGD